MINFEPYPNNPAKLVKSFVCFVDILGFSQYSTEAFKTDSGDEFLTRIRTALNNAYDGVREQSKSPIRKGTFYSIKIFTDNVVVGYPVDWPNIDLGEDALGHMFSIFSEFQLKLSMEGFLTRGGIAFGDLYMDDDIVFGDALLEAVKRDKSGGAPKISLAPSAVKLLQSHLGFYGDVKSSPQNYYLLQDSDETIFINYLQNAFIAFPDGPIFFEVFKAHKKVIENGLFENRSNPDVRAKYEWVARYHNFVCRDFVETHPYSNDPDADPADGAAIDEAQKLLNYIVDIESLAPSPGRLNIDPVSKF